MRTYDQSEYEPEPRRPVGPMLLRSAVIAVLAVALVLGGMNLIVPRVDSGRGSKLRTGWYLRSGQWLADARTAVAVVKFVVRWVPSVLPRLAGGPGTNTLAAEIAQTNTLTTIPTV